MKQHEIPVGFGMALAMNPEAMDQFAQLSDHQKQELINAAHAVNSKNEMQQLVESIKSMY